MMDTPKCDFCSDRPVVVYFEAKDVLLYVNDKPAANSLGSWAACETCRSLIDANDKDGLLERGIQRLAQDLPDDMARVAIAHVQSAFWESRLDSSENA